MSKEVVNQVKLSVPFQAVSALEIKRIKLFERLAVFAIGVVVLHFILHVINHATKTPVIDLIIAIFIFGCYKMHQQGYHTTARVLALSFLNLIITMLACAMPKSVGVYFYFVPLVVISMALFGNHQSLLRLLFSTLSAALLLLLFLSDFRLVDIRHFETPNATTFFAINIFSCTLFLAICMLFMERIYGESEKDLIAIVDETKTENSNLEKTNSELDRLLYSASHDLRSPLLSIKGLVKITQDKNECEQTGKYLTMIGERTDRLDSFIRDIIDYSKNARTEGNREMVDLKELVTEVQQNFQFLEGASSIDFQQEINPREVVLDRSRILIVLNNLISNAIKYHRADGEAKWIKTVISVANNILCIVVADNGQGIHQERKAKVFEMFYRATDRSQGSGLGLYIVKEVVEKMGGTITVDSIEGEGTSFAVSIPITPAIVGS
ncbi:HAMP domain-containing sensor histidine kinase [Chryseolinea sp. T2]|uniref:sensor histidine kinase n=1 Tax=Chryseolinea sp. T2 TaxID=3129255 RepID=UPI003078331D